LPPTTLRHKQILPPWIKSNIIFISWRVRVEIYLGFECISIYYQNLPIYPRWRNIKWPGDIDKDKLPITAL
jgi:hypothetical protein